jgi:hypothetical protein
MDEYVKVGSASSEAEAVSLIGLLESAGIEASYRVSDFGAGASDGWSSGAQQEIFVRPQDAELAREVLASD